MTTNVWVRHGGYFSVAQTRSEVLEARNQALSSAQFVHLDVVLPGTPGKASIDPTAITAVYEQTEPAGVGEPVTRDDVDRLVRRALDRELEVHEEPPPPSTPNSDSAYRVDSTVPGFPAVARLPEPYTPTPGSD